MLLMPLFIDVTTGNLITSLSQGSSISASGLPFYIGDTIQMQVYLLTRILNLPSPTAYPFSNVGTAGLALQAFITDGTISGPYGNENPYTQQVNWQADPTGSFFYADLALNTASLKALLADVTEAQATLKIGVYSNGLPQTIMSWLINLQVGIPEAPTVVPAPQHALSVEVADQTFFPIQPVPGQALYLMSAKGKIIEFVYVDNADGSATLEQNPQN